MNPSCVHYNPHMLPVPEPAPVAGPEERPRLDDTDGLRWVQISDPASFGIVQNAVDKQPYMWEKFEKLPQEEQDGLEDAIEEMRNVCDGTVVRLAGKCMEQTMRAMSAPVLLKPKIRVTGGSAAVFTCECGESHAFSLYCIVPDVHICTCGRRYDMLK